MDAATIVSIETTQAIQTFPPRVPLVARRRTAVRLMVRHNFGVGVNPLARARMRVVPESGPPSAWFDAANGTSPPAANPGLMLTLKSAPSREITDDSFNFLVPAALCVGTVQWEFDVRVELKGVPPALRGANLKLTRRSIPHRFRRRRRLDLRYVRVSWPVPNQSGSGTTNVVPTDDRCVAAIMDASQLFPMEPPLVSSALGAIMPVDLTKGADAVGDLYDRLMLFRDAVDPTTASVYSPAVNEIWCAIYDYPDYATRGLTVVGAANLVATADRAAIAHELSHCLRQRHLNAHCPLFGPTAFAEEPWEFEGGPAISDIPFDVDANAVVARPPGTGYWDVMTYCQGTAWVSVERWRRLWVQVGS